MIESKGSWVLEESAAEPVAGKTVFGQVGGVPCVAVNGDDFAPIRTSSDAGVITVTGDGVNDADPSNPVIDLDDVIETGMIQDLAVDASKLASNAVETDKIDDEAVTNAKLAQVATGTVKGRSTAGTGAVEDLTIPSVTAIQTANGSTAAANGVRVGNAGAGLHNNGGFLGRLCLASGNTTLLTLLEGATAIIAAVPLYFNAALTYGLGASGSNLQLFSPGDVQVGVSGALATDAAVGFLDVPSCAGTPTGTPSAVQTGKVPLVVDTTNHKLYGYYAAGWHDLTGT